MARYDIGYNPRRPYYVTSTNEHTWIGKHPKDQVVRILKRTGANIRKFLRVQCDMLNDAEQAKG